MDTVSPRRPVAPTNEPPPIISRDKARALGLKRFYPGTPCKLGHLAPLYVSTRACVQCLIERQRTPEGRAAHVAADERYRKSAKGQRTRRAVDARYRAKLKELREQQQHDTSPQS